MSGELRRSMKHKCLEIEEWRTSADGFNSTIKLTCPKCGKVSSFPYFARKVACGHCGKIIDLGF